MTDPGNLQKAALPSLRSASRSTPLKAVPVSQLTTASTDRATGWADVRAIFRISPPDESSWSMVEITRPHAVIGRKSGSDIAIAHPDLESLHTYLNFDSNGCFAIDLRTVSGMRVNGRAVTHGRLAPGDTLEVGGFLIRLDGLLVNGKSLTRSCLNETGLSADHTANLAGLTLISHGSKIRQWRIKSNIAFVGSEQTCSVALPENPTVSRIHGVFVRTSQNVFFVDLASRGTLLNGTRIYNQCIELKHGDTLSVGQRGLRVQISGMPQVSTRHHAPDHDSTDSRQELRNTSPADPQVMLAALLTQIQKQHDTALERQNEMQVAMAQLLRQVQNEQNRVMEKHLDRMHQLDQEIASLKSRINSEAPSPRKLEEIPSRIVTSFQPPPLKQSTEGPEPVRTVRKDNSEKTGDLGASPEYTTAWLIDRVNQLEEEQTSAWKEMLGRFLGR